MATEDRARIYAGLSQMQRKFQRFPNVNVWQVPRDHTLVFTFGRHTSTFTLLFLVLVFALGAIVQLKSASSQSWSWCTTPSGTHERSADQNSGYMRVSLTDAVDA